MVGAVGVGSLVDNPEKYCHDGAAVKLHSLLAVFFIQHVVSYFLEVKIKLGPYRGLQLMKLTGHSASYKEICCEFHIWIFQHWQQNCHQTLNTRKVGSLTPAQISYPKFSKFISSLSVSLHWPRV